MKEVKVSSLKVRKGSKEGWIEMLLQLEGGEEKKLIAKEVKEFWSERQAKKEAWY